MPGTPHTRGDPVSQDSMCAPSRGGASGPLSGTIIPLADYSAAAPDLTEVTVQGSGQSFMVLLHISSLVGTSITMQMQYLDPATDTWIGNGSPVVANAVGNWGILMASSTVTGTVVLAPLPGGMSLRSEQTMVRKLWRIKLTHTAVTQATYSISGHTT